MRHSTAPLLSTPPNAFRNDVLSGLARRPKSLPCKYFYDERGSQLFDRICDLDVYYPTRTELRIMQAHVGEMATLIGPRASLVELGSGSSTKTRILLDRLQNLEAYVPVDISREHLARAAAGLAHDYPHIPIAPVCADYSYPFQLPQAFNPKRTVVYFPGSTIGNLVPGEALRFLKVIAQVTGASGALLIGIDLKKDPQILDAAYNDPHGVTAAFNLNLLARVNRELRGDFDIQRFRHHAFYDMARGRVEMQLVSTARQIVRVEQSTFSFHDEEPITTEYSYKYDVDDFAHLAESAGFVSRRVWTDERRLFSVHYYEMGRSGTSIA